MTPVEIGFAVFGAWCFACIVTLLGWYAACSLRDARARHLRADPWRTLDGWLFSMYGPRPRRFGWFRRAASKGLSHMEPRTTPQTLRNEGYYSSHGVPGGQLAGSAILRERLEASRNGAATSCGGAPVGHLGRQPRSADWPSALSGPTPLLWANPRTEPGQHPDSAA